MNSKIIRIPVTFTTSYQGNMNKYIYLAWAGLPILELHICYISFSFSFFSFLFCRFLEVLFCDFSFNFENKFGFWQFHVATMKRKFWLRGSLDDRCIGGERQHRQRLFPTGVAWVQVLFTIIPRHGSSKKFLGHASFVFWHLVIKLVNLNNFFIFLRYCGHAKYWSVNSFSPSTPRFSS